jgi:hypothetical protein
VLPDQRGDSTELRTTIAATVVKTNRIEPEFRPVPITLYVNMGWLNPVLGVEEETIGPNSEHRRQPETCSLDYCRGKPPVTRTRRSALSAAHRAFLCRLTDRFQLQPIK